MRPSRFERSHLWFSLWRPDVAPKYQTPYLRSQQTVSYVWPDLLPYPAYTLDPVDLIWLSRIEYDAKMSWDRVTGITPPCGQIGLTWARLEVILNWGDENELLWLRFGSPAWLDGRRYVQVFTSIERGKDGQPHYTSPQAGVFRLAQKYEGYLDVGAPFLHEKH